MGQRIPLTKLVKIEEKPGAFVIRRKNRKRIFSVSGTLDKEITTPVKIAKQLEGKVADFSAGYPEVDIEFGGENKDTRVDGSSCDKWSDLDDLYFLRFNFNVCKFWAAL